uniref:Uncharacterized protein n=1 Tax=Picea glauca TaxID=3330 RepID=A0A101LUT9_PICGL|nr:hypothetical protein ABT39_MTgene2328 [Picea glauca]QHR89308.1 hypothetical protein Q903MT_gene3329 [Picea sitchensis]
MRSKRSVQFTRKARKERTLNTHSSFTFADGGLEEEVFMNKSPEKPSHFELRGRNTGPGPYLLARSGYPNPSLL